MNMSKYIARYLPQDGVIKQGDKYIVLDGIHKGAIRTAISPMPEYSVQKKVKLFLCSKILTVGTELWTNRTMTTQGVPTYLGIVDDTILSRKFIDKHWFTVAGYIDPSADWIQDGQEITEKNIKGFIVADEEDELGRFTIEK